MKCRVKVIVRVDIGTIRMNIVKMFQYVSYWKITCNFVKVYKQNRRNRTLYMNSRHNTNHINAVQEKKWTNIKKKEDKLGDPSVISLDALFVNTLHILLNINFYSSKVKKVVWQTHLAMISTQYMVG